jgi:hypothetical protein
LKNFPTVPGTLNVYTKKARNFKPCVKIIVYAPKALHHWNQSHEKEAPARRHEYEQLFQELIDEICLYLNEAV